MDIEQRIYHLFEDHLMTTQQTTEQVVPLMALAAETVVSTLVSDGCVFTCGNREGALIAQRFCDLMVYRLERERPALPAYFLPMQTSRGMDAAGNEPNRSFAEQVKAFGHSGDVLIIVSSDGDCPSFEYAIEVARERGMKIIALTGRDGGPLADVLSDADIEIRIPSPSTARVSEIHWLVVQCIGDLVDNLLFGAEDT